MHHLPSLLFLLYHSQHYYKNIKSFAFVDPLFVLQITEYLCCMLACMCLLQMVNTEVSRDKVKQFFQFVPQCIKIYFSFNYYEYRKKSLF